MRMRHPDIAEEIVVPDDEHAIAVHREAGWEEAAEKVQHHPALAPGEPLPDEPKTKSSKTSKPEGDGA